MATKVVDLGRVSGQSAYEAAVAAGYTGTEAEFYAALVALKNGPFLPLAGGTLTGNLRVGSTDDDATLNLGAGQASVYVDSDDWLYLHGEIVKAVAVCNDITYEQVRNIGAGTSSVSSLQSGAIYLQYE